ncbi:hypothetical protein AXX12_09655 [Anaerosporomusa subterranea]|uniref:Deoxynucleoside monophosphate kinase n=1 Tax=Anaerosporomusa subterranea TaxID=1794912 RepID=A0A154BRN8_ANASB|nr:hypothetical protein [Anaerosporomusa subterranea]KYZ76674.1 hypothetical protein AXX12_09655 [Anaerosporomusa subterranea]
MIVILLSGKAEAGKDTFFEMTAQRYAKRVIKRIAFADALKRIAFEMGWDGHKDVAGRRLLQDLGEIGRRYRADLWVDKTIETLKTYSRDADIVCFTDCRYPNELAGIQNCEVIDGSIKVVTVRIERPGHAIAANQNHISETALDGYVFDYMIINDGTLEDYRVKVLETVAMIILRSH